MAAAPIVVTADVNYPKHAIVDLVLTRTDGTASRRGADGPWYTVTYDGVIIGTVGKESMTREGNQAAGARIVSRRWSSPGWIWYTAAPGIVRGSEPYERTRQAAARDLLHYHLAELQRSAD